MTPPEILKAKVVNFDQLFLSQNDKKVYFHIEKYCSSMKLELESCDDFETRRKLLFSYVNKALLLSNKIILFGAIQISEVNKLEFQVERSINGTDRSRWSKAYLSTN